MNNPSVLILGGGFGGLAAARRLRALLPEPHRIVLVDRSRDFYVGATKNWVMLGERTVEEVSCIRERLVPQGVEVIEAEVLAIDTTSGEVTTTKGALRGGHLVIALGADYNLAAVPGLDRAAETFYTMEGAARLREILRTFAGGDLVVLIPRKPFKCPPAPYEAAMLLHEHLEQRGLREQTRLGIYTFEGAPMATAGPESGAFLRDELSRRGIHFFPQHTAAEVDADRRIIRFEEGGEASFDLLLAVPPHEAPRVVREAGLTGPGGWIPVDPETLRVKGVETGVPVYAIGDVTTITLPGRYRPDMPLVLPKAGVMAAAHGRVAAERIAAEVRGEEPTAVFDGHGHCYVELGRSQAMAGGGNFFELPYPRMQPETPSEERLREKLAWVQEWTTPVR